MEIFKIVILIVLTTSSSAASNVTTIHLQRHRRHDGSLEGLGHHLRSVRSVKGGADISLKDFQDMYYYAAIKIGTPGQSVVVEFDTGCSDLWVPSSRICKKNKNYCQQHKTYSHKNSSTYEKDGETFSITYGSGSVSGHISRDKISVGSLRLSNQEFGEATSVNENTASHKYDGIFGLAYPSLSRLGVDPPFVSMYKQGVLDKRVFAFYLSNLKMGTKQIHSSYNAMIDSGTSFLYGPNKAIETINKALNGTYEDVYLYVDCSHISNFPDISYVISGKPFVLHPSDYIFKVQDEHRCISGFIGFYDLSFFVLGDVFMRKFYTQFDMGNNRVGFATAK